MYFRNSYADLGTVFTDKNRKICIITDDNVRPLYLDAVKKSLGNVPVFTIIAGENSKNLATLEAIYRFFMEIKLDRNSIVFALGGGVVGDLAGFAAATFMRGIDYVQLPTTLIAQVDSGIGGKTAVNLGNIKNIVGAFHQPKWIYINISTLNTLPRREFISGMGEVVKHALISTYNDYFGYLHKNYQAINRLDYDCMLHVVETSCRIKRKIVENDEKETIGLRTILNFGHCVGHALESLSNYTLTHGVCVAIGMYAALKMSSIAESEIDDIISLFNKFELPHKLEGYAAEEILSFMYKDKKTLNDSLRVVLLEKIGSPYVENLDEKLILEKIRGITDE